MQTVVEQLVQVAYLPYLLWLQNMDKRNCSSTLFNYELVNIRVERQPQLHYTVNIRVLSLEQ